MHRSAPKLSLILPEQSWKAKKETTRKHELSGSIAHERRTEKGGPYEKQNRSQLNRFRDDVGRGFWCVVRSTSTKATATPRYPTSRAQHRNSRHGRVFKNHRCARRRQRVGRTTRDRPGPESRLWTVRQIQGLGGVQ